MKCMIFLTINWNDGQQRIPRYTLQKYSTDREIFCRAFQSLPRNPATLDGKISNLELELTFWVSMRRLRPWKILSTFHGLNFPRTFKFLCCWRHVMTCGQWCFAFMVLLLEWRSNLKEETSFSKTLRLTSFMLCIRKFRKEQFCQPRIFICLADWHKAKWSSNS